MSKQGMSRVVAFDLMRGYFLVGILIDHLMFFPSGLDWWSARGGLFVTMAEGFFLISGIVLGIVRGAKLVEEPFRKVSRLLLKRGVQLYLTTVALTLLFTFIVWWFYQGVGGVKPGVATPGTNIFQLLWDTVTLQYFYGWADYLRLYAVFLFASPIIFWLLRKGRWYVGLALSFVVWLMFPDPAVTSGIDQERLQMLSWQFLFFIGITIGFYWPKLVAKWTALTGGAKARIKTTIWVLTIPTFIYAVASMLSTMGYDFSWMAATPETRHTLFVWFFDKERLPLVRILLAMLWFSAGFMVFHRLEKFLTKWFGWLLIKFGTNSLYTYTVQAFLIFFVHIYLTSGGVLFNTFVELACIAITLVMIRYRVLMGVIPR